MKILLCHNFYQQPGGEDESFADEGRILEGRGHEVLRYTRHNAAIGGLGKLDLARSSLWNRQTYDELREIIARDRPDVIHCTNIFPLISPAAYDAADEAGVPIVQALRNYRLMCPNALFFRNGKVCEDCAGKSVAWPAVVHACYQHSRLVSAGTVTMLSTHRARGVWDHKVDLYFAPSEFTRGKYIEAGLPGERIEVKPNCVDPDPGPGDGSGGYVVFVGRLSREKGIETLLEVWERMPGDTRLVVVGDGPLADEVMRAAARDRRIEWVGRQPMREVLRIVGDAACLVMPSLWYETFGRAIVEAFSRGTPVVVSGIGAMAELVEHGRTGYHARPGDAADIADKLQRILADSPDARARMRAAAREEYLQKFTAEPNHDRLIEIYERAQEIRRERAR